MFEFEFIFKSTSINLMQMEARSHQYHQYNHVFENCILFILIALFARIEVEPETKIAPKKKTTVKIRVSSARQAAPPLIMSIKSHFPLYLLCMNRMITLMSILTA